MQKIEKYFTEYETLKEEEIKQIQQETAKDVLDEVSKNFSSA